MHRFFLPTEVIQSNQVFFPGEVSRQIAQVLRLKNGDQVAVLDNLGKEYQIELLAVYPQGVSGVVRKSAPAGGELPLQLSLYLCLTQREKFEWALQKCTETGVTHFVPVISSRSLVRDHDDAAKKQVRWHRIVREAAEQSGRGRIPEIQPVVRFDAALRHGIENHQRCLLAWEGETSRGLAAVMDGCCSGMRLAVLVGPEGGLSAEEVRAAAEHGWQVFSLGKRILRMETAAVVATARIAAFFEE